MLWASSGCHPTVSRPWCLPCPPPPTPPLNLGFWSPVGSRFAQAPRRLQNLASTRDSGHTQIVHTEQVWLPSFLPAPLGPG